MRAPAKPPQREGKGAGEERNGTEGDGGGEGGERAGGKAKRSGGSGGGRNNDARAKNKKTNAPHTQTPKTAKRVRYYYAPDRRIWRGVELGLSPRTGSSGGEPGATDWSIRGNGEKTIK